MSKSIERRVEDLERRTVVKPIKVVYELDGRYYVDAHPWEPEARELTPEELEDLREAWNVWFIEYASDWGER